MGCSPARVIRPVTSTIGPGGQRLAQKVPAPAVDAVAPMQFIDVRDLAQWIVCPVEHGEQGALNANVPVGGSGFGWATLLAGCLEQARDDRWRVGELVPLRE